MKKKNYLKKIEADYLKKIEICWFKKHGYLNGWKTGAVEWKNHWVSKKGGVGFEVATFADQNYVRFLYTQTDELGHKNEFDYKVELTTTPCNYGGKRYWFVCPLIKNKSPCERRVGILYKYGDYFGCRHCNKITYSARNKNRKHRLYPLLKMVENRARIEAIRQKMKRSYYAGKPTRLMRHALKFVHYIQLHRGLLIKNKK